MSDGDIQDLLAKLTHTPVEVAQLIDDLPLASAVIKPAPDEFSVLENICHLRDIEIEGFSNRIRRILTEEHPKLPDIDGAKLASERDYNTQDLDEALAAFILARRRNLDVLSDAPKSSFEREGELEGVGKITLGKLLAMMCDHDEGHVDELKVTRNRLLRSNET